MEEYAPAPVSEYSAPGYSAPGEVIDIGSLVLPILVVVGESFIIIRQLDGLNSKLFVLDQLFDLTQMRSRFNTLILVD